MTDVLAPVAGLVRPLSEVPDPVFAAEMVGAGVAIEPTGAMADAVSPVAGTRGQAAPARVRRAHG